MAPLRPSRRIEGVLFDLDGTLVDTEPHHHASTNRVLAAFGRSLAWEDYAGYIGVSELDFWAALRDRFALPLEPAALARRRTATLIGLLAERPVVLLPGVAAVLDLLERRGIPRAVASSSPAAQIAATLRAAGVSKRFQAAVSGHDDVPRSKPAPDVFLAAARAVGVAPAACLAIEDSATGVSAAVAAGAFVVAVRSPRSTLPAGADLALESLEDLVGPLEAWLDQG